MVARCVTARGLFSLLIKTGQKGPCCQWIHSLDDKVQKGLQRLAVD